MRDPSHKESGSRLRTGRTIGAAFRNRIQPQSWRSKALLEKTGAGDPKPDSVRSSYAECRN
jgi:hypothetical protein